MISRRILLLTFASVIVSTVFVFAAHQLLTPKEPGLAGMMPGGALLYIESPDFQSLLSDWSRSPQKQAWLASDNYAVFSRSRLFERLSQAQSEFASAAGLPPDMQLLSQIAGKQSAFAWYDVGKLEFLYISHVPANTFSQSALWQSRGKFDQRQSGKFDFYLRTDPQSKRTVAFAAVDDTVILGTREDLVATALALIGGAQSQSVGDESWYADSVSLAKSPGDLRMVLNLEKLVPSPYFRSYWIQQNITEMKQYRAAISDLYRGNQVYREERLLLRRNNAIESASTGDIALLAAAVPANTGFYKAIANPAIPSTLALLKDKLLDPRWAKDTGSRYVPNVTLTDQNTGQASDLETHIDQPPIVTNEADPWKPLQTTLETARITGALDVESTAPQPDGVFTQVHAAIVLSAANEWSAMTLESILSSSLESRLTTSRLGLRWHHQKQYEELDGMLPLLLSTRGKYLILANDSALLLAVQQRLERKSESQEAAVYASGFNQAQESANFRRTTTLIDRAGMRGTSGDPAAGQSPAFFSGNIGGLSQVFSACASESVTVRNSGNNVAQTVTYQWR